MSRVDFGRMAHLWYCTIPTEGAPTLRFFARGGRRCCRRSSCPLDYGLWMPSSYPPFDFAQGRLFAKYAKDGAHAAECENHFFLNSSGQFSTILSSADV